jgi:hypothetical protein
MELGLMSVLTIYLIYTGQRCNMRFLKHHTERTFAKCFLEACVNNDSTKRKATLLSSQLPPFKSYLAIVIIPQYL